MSNVLIRECCRIKCLAGKLSKSYSRCSGISDGPHHPPSKELHVTCERIGQIKAKALRKLRQPSRSRKLKDYLN